MSAEAPSDLRGRPPHEPTPETRAQVIAMATYGALRRQICAIVGIDHKTLLKHYRDELERGDAVAGMQIRKTLYRKAIEDKDTGALIWLDKTRNGAKETTRQETVATAEPDIDPAKLSTDELLEFQRLLRKGRREDDAEGDRGGAGAAGED